jgi:hypothetical protein
MKKEVSKKVATPAGMGAARPSLKSIGKINKIPLSGSVKLPRRGFTILIALSGAIVSCLDFADFLYFIFFHFID